MLEEYRRSLLDSSKVTSNRGPEIARLRVFHFVACVRQRGPIPHNKTGKTGGAGDDVSGDNTDGKIQIVKGIYTSAFYYTLLS